MINNIVLGFGFAEDCRTAVVIFTAETKFKNRNDALKSLTEYLYQKYVLDTPPEISPLMKECCKRYINKQFCADCGVKIQKSLTKCFDLEDFRRFLYEIQGSTINSYGEDYDVLNPDGWDPFAGIILISKLHSIILHENAECVICTILEEIHPELFENSNDS